MKIFISVSILALLLLSFPCLRPTNAGRAPGNGLRLPVEKHLRNIRQLTFGGENAEAYFSPDGSQLTFQSKREGRECDQIYTMRTDGSGVRMISTGMGTTTCSYFLPAQKRILFSSTHLGGKECPPRPDRSKGYVWAIFPSFDIFTTRPDGSDLKQLTKTPGYDAEATVSKDGRKIVFTSLRDGDLDIYTMDASGKNVRRLTSELGYDGGPFFSDDGKQIVYRAFHPQTPKEIESYREKLAQNVIVPTVFELWVMNADGSNKRQVTHLGAASFAPYFFPDGKRIIFSSNIDDPKGRNFDLYAVNTDGTGLERITDNETFDGFPMFSPDGKRLVFASNRNAQVRGETNVFIADWIEEVALGKLKGLIHDPLGGRIIAARIKIEGKDLKREIVSAEDGSYEVDLPPGRYKVSVEGEGFYPLRRQTISISANSTTTYNGELKGIRVDASHP